MILMEWSVLYESANTFGFEIPVETFCSKREKKFPLTCCILTSISLSLRFRFIYFLDLGGLGAGNRKDSVNHFSPLLLLPLLFLLFYKRSE